MKYDFEIFFGNYEKEDYLLIPSLVFGKAPNDLDYVEKGFHIYFMFLQFKLGLMIYKKTPKENIDLLLNKCCIDDIETEHQTIPSGDSFYHCIVCNCMHVVDNNQKPFDWCDKSDRKDVSILDLVILNKKFDNNYKL